MTLIDATGLTCPMPVLRLQAALRDCAAQSHLTLHATDPMAQIDVPHFAGQHGHIIVATRQHKGAGPGGADLYIFEIEKAAD